MYAHLKSLTELPFPQLGCAKTLAYGVLICILACGGSVYAEETADPFSTEARLVHKSASILPPCLDTRIDRALDLSGVVNTVLCNNPQTRELWANSRAQAAQLGVSQSGYLPNISASLAENQSTPGNRQRSIGLNFSYLLYDFGARSANLENARQLLSSVIATQDSTIQTLFLATVQAYYQSLATQAAFEASLVSERAAQSSFEAAQARYLAGSATPADKLAAQTAYSQSTLNRINAQGAMKIAQGNLANIMGLDANLNIRLEAAQPHAYGNVEKSNDFEQNISEMIATARQNRPDLQAAEAQVLAAQASAEAARAAGRPTISMTASSNQNSIAGINTHSSTLGLNLSVPLFTAYAPTYRIRAAEAQIETRKAQFDKIRLQIALDVWNAYQNLVTAMQNRRTTADLLSSAEQSERVALGRYKAGAGIMLDLLNAQTTLASARQQRIQAEFNWNINRATLAQAMGNLDARLLPGLTDNVSANNPDHASHP
jgi:outer membrane protein TolC